MLVSSEDFYAQYYDILYSHRNVKSEVDFLEKVFQKHAKRSVKKILDVGCGTGIHSVELARRGYSVLGVDASKVMIERAREKAKDIDNVSFMVADARHLKLPEKYDAAIAMYGVISYFTTDEDALDFLKSIRESLESGSIFVFDTWNMLGVLEKRVYYETPSTHVRKYGSLIALKEESWRLNVLSQTSTAEISWSVIDLKSGVIDTASHTLVLRLFTPRELKHLLRESGFEVVTMFEDYTCKPITESSSELVVVARAV
ncbi:methyltransferase type 11 [Infirmifilum uzonense]|uniref:Methyltransferase type 11 n=1 Tax=Infirmifilum uzonense TaxID=1550241 RepID=A0A0F7FHZ6_9CREN|nr:class I SAM-dependent methyltransferase [Infirmifilum uzonense]AKG38382.1 methyltransferase type 11 [Infirmifilum uzonense]